MTGVVIAIVMHVIFAKMSAKLVVHKFESGINFKTLQITIDDEDGGADARFGEWFEGKTQQKKKDTEKSSRVIVKLVSGEGTNHFNLDYCAKELSDPDVFLDMSPEQNTSDEYKQNLLCYEVNDPEMTLTNTPACILENYQNNISYDGEENERGSKNMPMHQFIYKQDVANLSNNNLEDWSPLEYSLEKVNENNARIMENIHMLNRTLNYTKKKEILDIVCQKSRYPCNTCGKCFVYETGLKRHYSMRHSLSEMQPRWQVVWTCVECFQVWPRQDLAMKHSTQCCKNDTADCVREIKTSSLLQCEFCEKVYTSIPRLLRHSKIHTTAKNYECNACESTFHSYKAAEQHWILCPWLKMCYSFSLPKMLLCNACDRKFKNYEQLYNHRYKVGHFMTKTHCNKGGVKSLGILVYQCEICGQWFTSISLLQNHRSQHHSVYDTGIQCQSDNFKECYNNCYEAAEINYYVNQTDNMQNQKYV